MCAPNHQPTQNPGKVQLCVAIVRYNTHGRARTGTATTYLQDRTAVGGRVPVFMSVNHEFRLPADARRPIIMIGPGTGLAPFRAFIQHRCEWRPLFRARALSLPLCCVLIGCDCSVQC
jgi:sulfite reductase alpha subunit-like flavoprotein